MRFVNVMAKDFLSLGDVDVPLDRQGLVLIEGDNRDDETTASNGAGKSSIFEALLWGLYGTTLKYGTDQDKVVRKGCKACSVIVVFVDDSGQEWQVWRTRPAKLALRCGGIDLTTGSIKETQALLDEAIGMDAGTFTNTVLFGQGNVVPFSALTDKEQKAVLERLIGIEALTEAHKKSRERLADVTNRLRAAEVEEAQVGDKIKEYVEDCDDARRQALSWDTSHAKALKEARAGAKKVGHVKEAQADVDHAKAALKDVEERLEAAESALETTRNAHTKLESALSATMAEVRRAELDLEKAEGLKATCRECRQDISPAHKASQVKDAKQTLAETRAEAKKDKERASQASDRVLTASTSVAELRKEAKQAQEALSAAKAALAQAQATDRVAATWQETLKRLEKEENTHAEMADRLEVRLKALKKQQVVAQAGLAELRESAKHWLFVSEALSNKGLKSFVLDSVVPFLNQKATEYAGLLSGGNLSVEFRTQTQLKSGEWREKFEVVASNAHGADVYAGNSGGEKRKIDVAVALALQALTASRAKSQIGLALYDEPIESLDATATEHMLDLLVEEAHRKETVLVITHNETAKPMFPTVWRVVKEGGVSSLEA